MKLSTLPHVVTTTDTGSYKTDMYKGKLCVNTTQHMHLVDITSEIQQQIATTAVKDGICHLFNPHTTAGLTVNEGADPDVRSDIIKGLREIVPIDYPFKHQEGNSPSHIMAIFDGQFPLRYGKLQPSPTRYLASHLFL